MRVDGGAFGGQVGVARGEVGEGYRGRKAGEEGEEEGGRVGESHCCVCWTVGGKAREGDTGELRARGTVYRIAVAKLLLREKKSV